MDNSFEDFQLTPLTDSRKPRRAYLVTYSQADVEKFPTRESFGNAVATAFSNGTGKVKVDYWACCLEYHQNGGIHYHSTIKLSGPKRWAAVKTALTKQHQVILNFSEGHANYYAAYKYITKTDKNVFHSENHPDLLAAGTPRTKNSSKVYISNKRKEKANKENLSESNSKKPRRLSNLEISEVIIEKNIQNETQLFALAQEQKQAGKTDLASFILNRNRKSLQDLMTNTWMMHNSTADLQRATKSRMDLINACADGECDQGCEGTWLTCASQVLENNDFPPVVFAYALRELLTKGRGKFRNLMIIGPANCGKTFLFTPLQKIFRAFSNPANDKYAWLGAEKAEVLFLNDFRYSQEMIAWKEMLLLLEGQTVHLPAPKNLYANDIAITSDIPIFATGKSRIKYIGRSNTTDEIENEMMDARWRVFEFHHQIPKALQKEMVPCKKCFAKLALMR